MKAETKGRGRVYHSILETIGNTPLVRLNRIAKEAGAVAEVYAKLEFFNPLSSVKDRIAQSMVEAAIESGKVKKDTVFVEPTSGNTGIALAFVCAAKQIPLILTMPDSMSLERRKMLQFLGAQLELIPAALGMKGAIARAEEIVQNNPNALMLQQFSNAANPEIHFRTTGEEIWNDMAGKVDVLVAGVGTGGTITGAGNFLRSQNPAIQLIAVEPEASPVISGGTPGPHKIQGLGAGFIPENLDTSLLNETIAISNDEAMETARHVAITDGIPVGISSGAAIAAALKVAARPANKGKRIVVIIPSTSERYLSTDLFAHIPA